MMTKAQGKTLVYAPFAVACVRPDSSWERPASQISGRSSERGRSHQQAKTIVQAIGAKHKSLQCPTGR